MEVSQALVAFAHRDDSSIDLLEHLWKSVIANSFPHLSPARSCSIPSNVLLAAILGETNRHYQGVLDQVDRTVQV